MQAILKAIAILLLVSTFSIATDVQGNVSGIWTSAGSPYNVIGDILIPHGSTLIIDPGVQVIFQDHYRFEVRGKLTAVGNELNMITFTADSAEVGWSGIRFILPDNTSEVSYCIFEHGNAYPEMDGVDGYGGALLLKFANITISNNIFRYNNAEFGGAIANWGSNPTIDNNQFHENQATGNGGAMYILAQASGSVVDNTIWNNTATGNGGAFYIINANPLISGNAIQSNTSNHGAGMYIRTSNATITDNVIDSNIATGNGVESSRVVYEGLSRV